MNKQIGNLHSQTETIKNRNCPRANTILTLRRLNDRYFPLNDRYLNAFHSIFRI